MTSLSPADQSGLFFLAIIVLIMVRRTYMLAQGSAKYGPTRIFAYGIFSMALFVYFAASTIYLANSVWGLVSLGLVVPYLAIVIAAAWMVHPVVQRRVTFDTKADGSVYYRLPVIIPVLSLVFFVVRLSVEVAMFGLASVTSFALPSSVSNLALAILIVFDVLFGASIGLLIGRGLGVRSAYEAQSKKGSAPLPTAPGDGATPPAQAQ
jgi:hypothetical protein